jgi:hypothetical protein
MYAGNQHEELSRQSLVQQAADINSTGRAYMRDAADADRFQTAQKKFVDDHREVAELTLMEKVEYLTFMAGLCCVYGIDIMLFGTSAQYIAALLDGGGGLWVSMARWAVPAFFLGIEIAMALKIEKARHAERFAFGARSAKSLWIAVGVIVALVMPLAAAATAQSVGVVAENSMSVCMVIVLAIISFAAHVLVLFAGRLAQEAKTYLAFALLRRFHDRRTNIAIARAKARLSAFNSMFIKYVHAWRVHNARYTLVPSGPFDHDVLQLLRREFPHVASTAPGPALRSDDMDDAA